MKIQTIHAFCQSLLRRFPLEADLAPQFDVMDERTADELLAAGRDTVLPRARFDPTSKRSWQSGCPPDPRSSRTTSPIS